MGEVLAAAEDLYRLLDSQGFRTHLDNRDNYKPGFKYNYWELRGVPIRIELGGNDMKKNGVTIARRDNLGTKDFISNDGLIGTIQNILDDIHHNLYAKAKVKSDERRVRATTMEEFLQKLPGNAVLVPFCEEKECENRVKEITEHQTTISESDVKFELTGKAKSLCIPFDQPELPQGTKCFCCEIEAKSWTYFGRSY